MTHKCYCQICSCCWTFHRKQLQKLLATIATTPCDTTESLTAGGQENTPLDRKRNEMKENLLVLEVQITSASGELQKLKAEQDELTPIAAIRERICNRCYQISHTQTTCKSRLCESSNNCKIGEKYLEMKVKISSLQEELKKIQKQHKKHRSELESLVDAREKLKSSFFFCYAQSKCA